MLYVIQRAAYIEITTTPGRYDQSSGWTTTSYGAYKTLADATAAVAARFGPLRVVQVDDAGVVVAYKRNSTASK